MGAITRRSPERGRLVTAWACVGLVMGVLFSGAPASVAQAIEITGVQNAALDQPRIFAYLRLPGETEPLSLDFEGETYFAIQAFYDTGASGVLISAQTADLLGVPMQDNALFIDVGVADTAEFGVSDALMIHLANYESTTDVQNPAVFTQQFGPLHAKVGPLTPPDNPMLEGLDVFGMPLFQNKSVVMDMRLLNQVADTIQTKVYDSVPGQASPDGWDYDIQIQTSAASFERFTQLINTVPGSDDPLPPMLNDNPFIGPDPVATQVHGDFSDTTPGITVTYNGASSTGSWLYDTGAAASIISQVKAAELGVYYDPNAGPGSEFPVLMVGEGDDAQIVPDQFRLTLGGIGGTVTTAGFFLDTMLMRTLAGDAFDDDDPAHLKYIGAPVLVLDITVQDPETLDSVTLDGVLGMNFFTPTMFISEPFHFGDVRAGAFDWMVYDHPSGLISLKLVPEPSALMILGGGLLLIATRRRRAA